MRGVEVAIIGAGTAGLSARSEVAKLTDNYLVIDAGPLGTTCARVGCMPSKALIHSANAFHRRHEFWNMGITGGDKLGIDPSRVMEEMRKLRDHFTNHVISDMDEWKDDHLIEGRAHFNADGILCVGDTQIKAKRTILATGSSPVVPKQWSKQFGDRIITTDTLFELPELPKKMAVIGLGPVGAELGQALARLDVEIIAFNEGDGIGGLSDPYLQKHAAERLSSEFKIINERAELCEAPGGKIRVTWPGGHEDVDLVFASAGRKPNLEHLGLENAGVELEDKGLPDFDKKTLRIKNSELYVAGDANGEMPVLHEASDEGRIAGYNAVRDEDVSFDRRMRTLITFTDPEIAQVGQSFKTLTDSAADFVIGEASFENQGRALLSRHRGGCVRIYVAREDGTLLGAEMFAPAAEHFAHMLTRGLEVGVAVHEALSMPFYHPVLEEGVRSALYHAAKQTDVDYAGIETMRCMPAPVEKLLSPD